VAKKQATNSLTNFLQKSNTKTNQVME
jgi:hypothetical protein